MGNMAIAWAQEHESHCDCISFACFSPPDPTISFAGLQTWKRNLASLTIFVKEPQITLYNIKLDKQAQTITTEWRLSCVLGLPWRPCIEVDGGTVHR